MGTKRDRKAKRPVYIYTETPDELIARQHKGYTENLVELLAAHPKDCEGCRAARTNYGLVLGSNSSCNCDNCRARRLCYTARNIAAFREELRLAIPVRAELVHVRTGERIAWPAGPVDRGAIMRELKQRVKILRADRRVARPLDVGMVTIAGRKHPINALPVNWRSMLLNVRGKGPIGPTPHVGLEIECGVRAGLGEALLQTGLAARIDVAGDGSLHIPGRDEVEIRACLREDQIADAAERICTALASVGGKVNATCGLHVHIDVRKRDPLDVYARLLRAMPWLYAVVSPSRKSGRHAEQYCARPTKEPDYENRYRAVNFCSVSAHRTIEVRLHHGTIDARKITMWCELLLAIVKAPTKGRCPRDLSGFAHAYGLRPELVQWIRERIITLNGAADGEVRIEPPRPGEAYSDAEYADAAE